MSMMQEFKTFIQRGNVMDLAVGVIIGGACRAAERDPRPPESQRLTG